MSERDAAVREWMQGEERLYPVVTTRPDLYEACTGLVRSLADHLANVPDLDALVATYRSTDVDADLVAAGLDELDLSPEINRDFVRQSAYAVRSREIAVEEGAARTAHHLRRAARAGEGTVVLWSVGENPLRPPYRRVEMELASGRAIVTTSEISAETMTPMFTLAAVQLDPATGDPTDEDPLAPERLFDHPDTWNAAAAELRGALFTDEGDRRGTA